MNQTAEILLIRLGGLGDVVFTFPAIRVLRAAFPHARLTYLVYKEFAPLLEGVPQLNAILQLDRSRYRGFRLPTILAETKSILGALRRPKFGLTVDFQGFGETGWLSWWTQAPQRWGCVYRRSRRWAYTRAIPRNPRLHPIEYNLDLLRQSGRISDQELPGGYVVPDRAAGEARRLFTSWNLDHSRPTCFIQPFSNGEHKNWPLAAYLDLAQSWRKRGLQVLFGGGPAERLALQPALQAGFPVAAGTELLVSAGLVSLSSLVVGGDTGLLHLAVAMGKRVVMIMGSVRPGSCFPFRHPEWAVVPASGGHVASISLETVMDACDRALAEPPNHPLAGAPRSCHLQSS